MKQFFTKWKKAICLSVLIVLMFMEMKGACYASAVKPQKLYYDMNDRSFAYAVQASEEDDNKIYLRTRRTELICSTKSILLKGHFYANVQPTGIQIYRAKVKANGKNGKFKEIGNCKDFSLKDVSDPEDYTFTYEDTTVKTGNAYAYKYKVYYGEKGGTPEYVERYSDTETGVAAKTVGEYTCKVVKSTAKKLIVKLTGKSKNNGPLSPYYGVTIYYKPVDVYLRYKNDGEEQFERDLELMKFSYDGKKWYNKGRFTIKGKQSVYLHFKEMINKWDAHNIKITDYQYVQMLYVRMRYNLQGIMDSGDEIYDCPQLLCNLSSGKATVDDFVIFNFDRDEPDEYRWDGGIFK